MMSGDSTQMVDSRGPDDACDSAMRLQIAGHLEEAARVYLELLRREPNHPMANHCLGLLHVQSRQPEEGLPYLLNALNTEPESRDYWLGYLEGLLQASQIDTAREALALGRQHGLSGTAVEQFAARLTSAEPAAAAPIEPAAHKARPIATPARPSRLKATTRRSREDAQLLVLMRTGRVAEAFVLARAMTQRFPQHGLGWKIYGALLWTHGDSEAALAAMLTSTRWLPRDAEAHSNLGSAFAALKRFDDAEIWLCKAIDIDPTLAAVRYRLGMYYELQARYDEAEASLRMATSMRSDPLSTDDEQGYSNLLYVLSHNPKIDTRALFTEHRQVGDLFESKWRSAWPRHSNVVDPNRRLQIGFVSGDLHDHSVALFLEPLLQRLTGRHSLELHAYYNYTLDDRVTARLRGLFGHWHPIAALTDADLAAQISDDRIDILIDLSGHMARNRLRVFARKPAPVQVSWLGYPGTTGLQAVDYYLADRRWLPRGEYDESFTEKLVYLPDRWAFTTHVDAPAVNTLPALETGHVTFGSFHRAGKINATTLRSWSDLLRAVPDARMLVAGLDLGAQKLRLREHFATHGVPAERLMFHDRCTMPDYLALHHRVDVALDTQPFAGATTTMHSLSMGVPTLTIAGATAASRACAGILAHVGLDAFIAADAAGFVEAGLYWAGHLQELADVRASLRTRLSSSPGGQPEIIAAHFDGALRHMWTRWCAGLPAESFDSVALEPAP